MTTTETAALLRRYNVWRRGNLEGMPQPDPREIGEAIDAAIEMIDRLEAAEKEVAHIKEVEFPRKARAVAVGWEKKCARLEQERDALRAQVIYWKEQKEPGAAGWRAIAHKLRKELEALRAKIEAMERQELGFRERCAPSAPTGYSNRFPLYTLPGAQPAPSAPEGWLRAIDEALVVAHVGVANESDTYEQAREKLNSLIGWHTDVATDPVVNGGYKLVPIEPTPEMVDAIEEQWMCGSATGMARREYLAALAAAPEAKP